MRSLYLDSGASIPNIPRSRTPRRGVLRVGLALPALATLIEPARLASRAAGAATLQQKTGRGAINTSAIHPAPRAATAAKAYIGLFKDNALAIVDTGAGSVVKTIPLPPGPHGLAITPDGRWLFVSCDGASTVSVIDTASDELVDTVEVGPQPHGLAGAPAGDLVLASVFGANAYVALESASHRVAWQVPVPQPHNSAVSPDGRLAYVASQAAGAQALVIIDLAAHAVAGTIPLDKTPRALSFDPAGRKLFFTLAGVDAVQVLDVATNQVEAQIAVGASPHHPLITPGGELGLVVSQGPGELTIFDPASHLISQTLRVGQLPHWIATSADGGTAYVTNEGSNDLSVVDLRAGEVVATIQVGNAPRKIVVQPPPGAPAAADGLVQVRIASFAFDPPSVVVAAGQPIMWTNADAIPHTVTGDDTSFASSPLQPGQQFSAVLAQPGAYTYHCEIHPFMKGTVTVRGA